MVDQIETAATAQRAVTSAAGEQSDVIATLQTAERYDHLRIAPLDVTCRVLNQIGNFGVDGVRAAGDDTTYLLVAESDPASPTCGSNGMMDRRSAGASHESGVRRWRR